MIRAIPGTNRPGLNRVVWDLLGEASEQLAPPNDMPQFVDAGAYEVTITYGERSASTSLTVLPAPGAEHKE